MKKFTVINEEFTCENCGEKNPKLEGSCRNHCKNCLYSKHVDDKNPGDRQSVCKALLKPIYATQNSKKGWIIHHKCTKCDKEIPNKAATDDDFELIIELTQYNERTRSKKTRK